MNTSSQEALAFQLIFRGNDALSVAMRSRITDSIILDRKDTGVGFYSNIKLIPPLDEAFDIREIWARNFVFNYPSLPHGAHFNCSFDSLEVIEIEGVGFGDDKWPDNFDASLISEIEK